MRLVKQRLILSNGTSIPPGTIIAVPSNILDADAETNQGVAFDGYRSYRRRQEPGQEGRHQLFTTSADNLQFGYGRLACPGRFFAALELKMMFASLLMQYDFKFADGKRPQDLHFSEFNLADVRAPVLVRKRRVEEEKGGKVA